MEEHKKRSFRFTKLLIVIGVCLGIGIAAAAYMRRPVAPEFSSVFVEKKDLVQSVSETGSVVADLKLQYGWEIPGRVVSINTKVGDVVTEGDLIAELHLVKERAKYQEALSSLSAARARLNVELVGPSEEQKQEAKAALDQAKAALDQAKADRQKTIVSGDKAVSVAQKALETAKNNLQRADGGEESQIVTDAYEDLVNTTKSVLTTVADSIVEADNILGVDNSLANDDFDDYLSIADIGRITTAEQKYLTAKKSKQAAEQPVLALRSYDLHETIDVAAALTQEAVLDTQTLLFMVQSVLDATRPLGSLSQSELETLKANITAAQAATDSAGEALTNSLQGITTSRNSLSLYTIAYEKALLDIENEKKQAGADVQIADALVRVKEAAVSQAKAAYDVLVAPPRDVDLASLRADVAREEANVLAFQSDVEKGRLVALTDGIVSFLDVDIGETVSANQHVVTIISKHLTVDVDVSESDIAKISLQDPVDVTLDAFTDDDVFTGQVISIEPAETELSGVVYYKTKIMLDDVREFDIRPGMTANITITTERAPGAIVVPQRAVLQQEGKHIVRVLTNPETGAYDEVPVTLGLRGDNGEVQVTSGLSEGQEIITFIKQPE